MQTALAGTSATARPFHSMAQIIVICRAATGTPGTPGGSREAEKGAERVTFRLTDPDGQELGCWNVPRLDSLFRYFVACRELPVSIWQRLDAQMRLAPTASTWNVCGYTLRRVE